MEQLLPILSFIVILFVHASARILSYILRRRKKLSPAELKLNSEIKDLVRQASSLSTPSTFAKAAKLRREAAVKEKELAKLRQSLGKGKRLIPTWQSFIPMMFEVVSCLALVCFFWSYPVSTVPSRVLYPFAKTLGWTYRGNVQEKGLAKIGILPWLAVCSRVSIFLTNKFVPL